MGGRRHDMQTGDTLAGKSVDPADGQAYTFKEIQQYWHGQCNACNDLVYAARGACRKCGASRPEDKQDERLAGGLLKKVADASPLRPAELDGTTLGKHGALGSIEVPKPR